MGTPHDRKYYVIRAPYKGIDEYVFVPRAWIVLCSGDRVLVSYPLENPMVTENRVRDGEGRSKEWKSYRSVVKHSFNSYHQAKYVTAKMNYQQNVCSNKESEGNKSGGSVQKRTHRSERFNSNQNFDKPLDIGVSSKNDDRSAPKLKQIPQSKPETKAVSKRSKVADAAESDSEDTEQSCQGNENSSLEPITIANPELFTVILTRLRDLHKSSTTNHLVIDIVCKTLNMNDKVMKEQAKLIDELRAALASKSTTTGIEKKQGDMDDDDGDDNEFDGDDNNDDGDDYEDYKVRNKNRYPKPKIVLPPEYDENNSRWSLKHRVLEPGLVELMPQTSVYINAIELNHCKRLAKTCRGLARMLLLEIFTKSALSVCSLTGSRARAYDRDGAFIRPGLDKIAINSIINFVEEYRRAKGWKAQNNQSTLIKNSIRNLMKMIRVKYGA